MEIQEIGALLNGIGILVALAIAVGGWLYESSQRRSSERERALAFKRGVYLEAASTLHGYLLAKSDSSAHEFWDIMFKLVLVAPDPVLRAVFDAAAVRHRTSDVNEADAINRLLNEMRDDLGEDKLLDSPFVFDTSGE